MLRTLYLFVVLGPINYLGKIRGWTYATKGWLYTLWYAASAAIILSVLGLWHVVLSPTPEELILATTAVAFLVFFSFVWRRVYTPKRIPRYPNLESLLRSKAKAKVAKIPEIFIQDLILFAVVTLLLPIFSFQEIAILVTTLSVFLHLQLVFILGFRVGMLFTIFALIFTPFACFVVASGGFWYVFALHVFVYPLLTYFSARLTS